MNRKQRAEYARVHTMLVRDTYEEQIERCVERTKIYKHPFSFDARKHIETNAILVDMDTVSALSAYAEGRTAVLNFASYRHPGGGFMTGAMAQEEALCHESFLYDVLEPFDGTVYEYNRNHVNDCLYANRGLYSPDVVFMHGDKTVTADVISVAAPNRRTALNHGITERQNSDVLKSRIRFVLDIAGNNEIDTLILGAYGCGAFGQDPREVAGIFGQLLTDGCAWFRNAVFAIPDTNANYDIFRRTLTRYFDILVHDGSGNKNRYGG